MDPVIILMIICVLILAGRFVSVLWSHNRWRRRFRDDMKDREWWGRR